MKTILKVLLYLVLFLLITSCIGVAFMYPSLRMQAIVAGAGIIALIVIFTVFRKILIRKKEKAFVQRVIRTDKAAIQQAPADRQPGLNQLQDKWMQAVNRLRTSKLRQTGNPLYALPWYLIIGESGTGKTSSIIHSGLSSPLSDLNSTQGLAVTRNCDWWFFNEAIILDTPGRYAVPLDAQRDTAEWQEFLGLVARFRKREPVNGIVVALGVDTVIRASSEELVTQGKLIRSRIDQVVRAIGSGFPVYIMVTKLDLVFGMAEFFRALPSSHLGQAMGWSNMEKATYSDQILSRAMAAIEENLKDLQFRLVNSVRAPEPEILIFPDRFAELTPKLQTFCKALFVDSVFLETPLFRGIYFSSAVQKIEHGTAEPALHDESKNSLSGGMFLCDFFSRVLPSDRYLNWPTAEFTFKRYKEKWTVLGSWSLVWLFVLALVWLGFKRNEEILLSVKPTTIQKSTPVVGVEKMRTALHMLKKQNRSVLPFWMGFHQSRSVEKKQQQDFLSGFEQRVFTPIETAVNYAILKADSLTSEEQIMTSARYLTAHLGLLKNPDPEHQSFAEYRAAALEYLPTIVPEYTRGEMELFVQQYSDWLQWTKTETPRKTEKRIYRQLASLIELKGANLRWCSRYPVHGIDDITLRDFWPHISQQTGTQNQVEIIAAASLYNKPVKKDSVIGTVAAGKRYAVVADSGSWIQIETPQGLTGWVAARAARSDMTKTPLRIEGAFTQKARERIDAFLSHIDSAITDPVARASFGSLRDEFTAWYTEEFYRQWRTFTRNVPLGLEQTKTLQQFRTLTSAIADYSDPFSKYLKRLQNELNALPATGIQPAWAQQALLLDAVVKRAKELQAKDSAVSLVQKKTREGIDLLKKIGQQVDEAVDNGAFTRNRLIEASAKDWTAFEQSQAAAVAAAVLPGGASQLGRGLFSVTGTAAQEYRLAESNSMIFQKRLLGARYDRFLWAIVTGPLAILRGLAYQQACADVQEAWERDVIVPARRTTSDKRVDLLFAPQTGLVRQLLLDSTLAPFIYSRTDGSLSPVAGPDGPLPFTDNFLIFVNQGIKYNKKSEYVITIQAIPFMVNPDAGEEPYQTILRLQCSDDAPVLENFNYQQALDFVYHPDNCGEVILKIIFPSFMVTKTWPDRFGFPLFLRQFVNGSYVFRPDDFDPQYQVALKRKKITWIRITYDIERKAAAEVIELLNTMPEDVPSSIIEGATSHAP